MLSEDVLWSQFSLIIANQDVDEVLFSLRCLFDELHVPKHRHDVYQKFPIGMTITFLRSELLSNLCRLSS